MFEGISSEGCQVSIFSQNDTFDDKPFLKQHVSNEKRAPGCLGYIGDEKLPSYIGIIDNLINYKDFVIKHPVFHGK